VLPVAVGPVEVGPVAVGPVEVGPVEVGPVEVGPVVTGEGSSGETRSAITVAAMTNRTTIAAMAGGLKASFGSPRSGFISHSPSNSAVRGLSHDRLAVRRGPPCP
jgi:hypothetical protein